MAIAPVGPSHSVGPFPFREPMPPGATATPLNTRYKNIAILLIIKGITIIYNESLLEITNLTVKIQKLAQHIIKLINITTFAHYMIC